MKFNSTIFRTYDIRGIYPGDFDREFVYNLGLAYANLFPKAEKVVVARDVRDSGEELKRCLIDGLLDGGLNVFEIEEIVPTPLMSFSICYYQLGGGIMITASHNPKQWNGFKIQLFDALQVTKEKLDKVEQWITDNKVKKREKRGQVQKLNPTDDYINYLISKIKLKRSLKVILDPGNGSCNYLPEKIFSRLGCQVKTLFGEFNDSFPNHLPDPYHEENLEDLKREVSQEKTDIGFGYDGDGDRLGVIDGRGRLVSGDDCLTILAREALKVKRGPVICEVRTSQAFLEDIKKNGGWTEFSVCYHTAVLEKIVETKAVFGGETTGHFYFPLDYYLYDDAIFASLKVAQIVSEQEDFAAYLDNLSHYYISPEVFIDYPDESKKQAVERFINLLKNKGCNFIDIDGARINFDNGWALARFSNTSPMIKIRFEGRTKEDLIKIEKEVIALMAEADIKLSEKNLQELGLKQKRALR
jgi:phosphomannomutase/phosphoglucomutase